VKFPALQKHSFATCFCPSAKCRTAVTADVFDTAVRQYNCYFT